VRPFRCWVFHGLNGLPLIPLLRLPPSVPTAFLQFHKMTALFPLVLLRNGVGYKPPFDDAPDTLPSFQIFVFPLFNRYCASAQTISSLCVLPRFISLLSVRVLFGTLPPFPPPRGFFSLVPPPSGQMEVLESPPKGHSPLTVMTLFLSSEMHLIFPLSARSLHFFLRFFFLRRCILTKVFGFCIHKVYLRGPLPSGATPYSPSRVDIDSLV